MADGDTREIFCSACNVAAQAVIKSDESRRIQCPRCGREDGLKEAIFAATRYQVGKAIGASLGGGRSKNIVINRGSNPKPRFVFKD